MAAEAGDSALVLAQGDAVLVIDVFNSFEHDDGDALLDSFRERAPRMERAVDHARSASIPLVYVNDAHGSWDSDVQALLRETLSARGGEVVKSSLEFVDEAPLRADVRALEAGRPLP